MHMIYQMRYSYFGTSGWKSETAQDKAKLFDDARLDKRHYFLEKIALRSLADQLDRDFGLVVLTSEDLPDRHARRLRETCGDLLGDRAHVIQRPPDKVGLWFKRHLRQHFDRAPWSVQIVLDDDDAVSADFTARLRAEAAAAVALRGPGEAYSILSHARGISAVFRDGRLSLRHRNSPATNLGLALVAKTGSNRNPYNFAHKFILERRPVRVIYSQTPAYIRAIHDTNDSRAQYTDDIVKADEMAKIHAAFPLLKDLIADWPLADKATQPGQAA